MRKHNKEKCTKQKPLKISIKMTSKNGVSCYYTEEEGLYYSFY